MNIALCKRVLSDLPDECPKAEIMKVPNSVFIPNTGDCQALENDISYNKDPVQACKVFEAISGLYPRLYSAPIYG